MLYLSTEKNENQQKEAGFVPFFSEGSSWVAQLLEWLLLTPLICSLNPLSGNFYLPTTNWIEQKKINGKRPGMAQMRRAGVRYWTRTQQETTWMSIVNLFFFKKWAIPGLFFIYFHLFNTVDNKQMLNKFCRWLESNRGPLVSKATALPTEPQPLPIASSIFNRIEWSHLIAKHNWLLRYCSFLPKSGHNLQTPKVLFELLRGYKNSTKEKALHQCWVTGSVTSLGNLLDFGQLFKAFGSN